MKYGLKIGNTNFTTEIDIPELDFKNHDFVNAKPIGGISYWGSMTMERMDLPRFMRIPPGMRLPRKKKKAFKSITGDSYVELFYQRAFNGWSRMQKRKARFDITIKTPNGIYSFKRCQIVGSDFGKGLDTQVNEHTINVSVEQNKYQ